jgi:hypothetical protein
MDVDNQMVMKILLHTAILQMSIYFYLMQQI